MSVQRKGFTLVEVAVILVVIGIVMGIGIKSMDLIDAAEIRQEISKFNRINLAYRNYFASTGRRLPIDTSGVYNVSLLASAGHLTTDDLKQSFNKHTNHLTSYTLVQCSKSTNRLHLTRGERTMCITTTISSAATNNCWQSYASAYLVCHIENMLDDNNMDSGHGRGLVLPYCSVSSTEVSNVMNSINKCGRVNETLSTAYGISVDAL